MSEIQASDGTAATRGRFATMVMEGLVLTVAAVFMSRLEFVGFLAFKRWRGDARRRADLNGESPAPWVAACGDGFRLGEIAGPRSALRRGAGTTSGAARASPLAPSCGEA